MMGRTNTKKILNDRRARPMIPPIGSGSGSLHSPGTPGKAKHPPPIGESKDDNSIEAADKASYDSKTGEDIFQDAPPSSRKSCLASTVNSSG